MMLDLDKSAPAALVKKYFPRPLVDLIRRAYERVLFAYLRWFGWPYRPGETTKARTRREREGFFDAYCRGRGLDIGHGGDPLLPGVDVWDVERGDVQAMKGATDGAYDFVYSSHVIEHMIDPAEALRNWWRLVRPGGHLLLYLPHRDLYEKKDRLPSRWNVWHRHFFLVDRDDPPDTLGIVPLIERTLDGAEIVYAKECSEGHTITDPEVHSDGEYSIEVVVRRRA